MESPYLDDIENNSEPKIRVVVIDCYVIFQEEEGYKYWAALDTKKLKRVHFYEKQEAIDYALMKRNV